MTSRPVIGRTRIGLLNTMFSASSSLTWAGVGLPDSRSLRKGCIVIPPMLSYLLFEIEQRLTLAAHRLASAAPLCPSPSPCAGTRPLFHRRIFEIHDAIGGRATDEFCGKSAPDIILVNRPKR